MKSSSILALGLFVAGGAVIALAQSQPAPSPTVKVGPAVAAQGSNPAPGPKATNQGQKTSIGKGAASVKASGPSMYWTDLVDVDADGVVEDNQFLYDAKRGIVYTYRYDNFSCANGKPESGDVLMGIYAKGNPAGKPAGSGWFVVAVNAGQCGEKKAGTFGCRFDASGNPTSCGVAIINEASGEVDVAIAKQ